MGVVFKLFIQLCVSHAMRFRIAGDDFVPPLSRLSAHFPQAFTSEDVNFSYVMTMWVIVMSNIRLEGLGKLQTAVCGIAIYQRVFSSQGLQHQSPSRLPQKQGT